MHIWWTVPDAELVTDNLTTNERNMYSLGLIMKSLGVRYIQTAADAEDSVTPKHKKKLYSLSVAKCRLDLYGHLEG